jgi:hypothetical protein
MIQFMEGFTFTTALDLKMGYHHIKLDADTQNQDTIIFTCGKVEHLGYWITRQGIQPVYNRVEAILKIKYLTARKEEPCKATNCFSQLLSLHFFTGVRKV